MQARIEKQQTPNETTPSIEEILQEFKWFRKRYEAYHDFIEQHHPELNVLWRISQTLELAKRT